MPRYNVTVEFEAEFEVEGLEAADEDAARAAVLTEIERRLSSAKDSTWTANSESVSMEDSDVDVEEEDEE